MSQVQRLRSRRSLSSARILCPGISFIYLIAVVVLSGFLLFQFLVVLRAWRVHPLISFHLAGEYSVTGKPSINADFINLVLSHYHSPAQEKGQALYDYGIKYGIDPAYALAFFMHESVFGTQGVATVTHSLGNIRATAGYQQYNGYRFYNTWEAGFEDWYRLIAQQYVGQWSLATIDQIIPVYAPSSDNNDEGAYIRTIKLAVETWRQGAVEV